MARVERKVATAARVPEPAAIVECRSAPRIQASAVPSITGVRLSPFGADATLLNISKSGVLVECTSRIRLGTAVTTVFDGTFAPSSVEGRVARSSVAGVSKTGALRYQIGIAFTQPIALETAAPAAAAAASPQPEAAPQQAPSAPSAAPAPPALFNRW